MTPFGVAVATDRSFGSCDPVAQFNRTSTTYCSWGGILSTGAGRFYETMSERYLGPWSIAAYFWRQSFLEVNNNAPAEVKFLPFDLY